MIPNISKHMMDFSVCCKFFLDPKFLHIFLLQVFNLILIHIYPLTLPSKKTKQMKENNKSLCSCSWVFYKD